MGAIDRELESRLARKQKCFNNGKRKNASAWNKLAKIERAMKTMTNDGDDDNDNNDHNVNDVDYHRGSFGHERVRPKRLSLEFAVDVLRDSFANISDRRGMTSHDRSDVLTNFVEKGGGDLTDLPCSQKTMVK